jgi:nicotinate-nucleotide adenylyltransferase
MGVIGLYGGTFDPPHLGHLAAAQEALEAGNLDRLLFVPNDQNHLKQGAPTCRVDDRLTMTTLAIAGNPAFELSRADVGRPGPSYTVDLIERLQEELGQDQQFAFIAGMDVLHELHRWREPGRLLELVRLLIVQRPGEEMADLDEVERRVPGASRRIQILDTSGVAISSTELRERVAAGRSIRYLVPDAVVAYIREHGLYRTE